MTVPETALATTGLCRNCASGLPAQADRCPACGSPRTLFHDELHTLSIAHLDCDAFYASVEKRDDPSLNDKPVIVGGGQRGVVSAACYIARISGVHSAMPMFKALKLCPDATVIRPEIDKYVGVGRQIRELMREISPLVEPLSVDEAFLDLSGTQRLHRASPATALIRLVNRIERDIGVTASIGLSYNKFLAKLASDMEKPRGFAIIGQAEAIEFLDKQPVTRIWGVGRVLHRKLASDGLQTIGQLRSVDEKRLSTRYGAMGLRLGRFSRGEDARSVTPHSPPKNISTETTFSEDIFEPDELKRRLWQLCEKLSGQVKIRDLAGRTVTLKLKTSAFKTFTRSRALPSPTQLAETLFRYGEALVDRAIESAPKDSRFRLIGIGLSNITNPLEADPPDLADPDAAHRKRIEQVMDEVRGKLGHDAITKGRGLKPGGRKAGK
ncbi:MAG: DNA polymerase IV [Alphaproteobacteria bacterium]|jgi:DNA polymerase-4|nr:DNA polymerase IV [Alphaproteobacteria bacterium]